MDKAILYIHGKGGSPKEASYYKPLFREYDVIGFDYKSQSPQEAEKEFPEPEKLFRARSRPRTESVAGRGYPPQRPPPGPGSGAASEARRPAPPASAFRADSITL